MATRGPSRGNDGTSAPFDEINSTVVSEGLAAATIAVCNQVDRRIIEHQRKRTARMDGLSVGLNKLKDIDWQFTLSASFVGVVCHPHDCLLK
jgi:hypothetical protein